MKNDITMSIYAEALVDGRKYKNAKINGEAVGVGNARTWSTAVKAMLIPAYAIRVYRHDHMADATTAKACDQTPLYDALRTVLDLVGEVNGAKLDAHNCAEEIIAQSVRFRAIDTSEEMAHAHLEKSLARKALNNEETDENQAEYDKWTEEVKRLEALPGNCKKIPEIQSETAFMKAVELLLGDAITKQTMKSAEEVIAEREAKKAAQREKAKARKRAKKAEETKADK